MSSKTFDPKDLMRGVEDKKYASTSAKEPVQEKADTQESKRVRKTFVPRTSSQQEPSPIRTKPDKSPESTLSLPGNLEVLRAEKTYKNDTTAIIDYLPDSFAPLCTKAKQVARPDLPMEYYMPRIKEVDGGKNIVVEKVKGNFDLYNFDLNEKLSDFSADNQKAGGVAITRSQITEACLDFIFYDLELGPNGFKSTEDVRNHLRSLIK